MGRELKSCEHKQTIVVDNSLAEWCEDCGAFRIKTRNPWRWGEWYYPNKRPAASVPSVEILTQVIGRVYCLPTHKKKQVDSKLCLDIVDAVHALLTEGK